MQNPSGDVQPSASASAQPPPRPTAPGGAPGAPSQPSSPQVPGHGAGARLRGYEAAATHFPDGLTLNGDLNAEEDVVIDGVLTGAIDMPAHALTIGPNARVNARILARDITVHGSLSGKVTAIEIIDIRDKARVSGELAAPSVALAEGARVQGRVETKRVDAAVHVARYRMGKGGTDTKGGADSRRA